jgi:Ca2+-binding RTX toxin-like protein
VALHGDNARATVNVGNDAGSLDEIQGPLNLDGANSSVALNVNDQGAAAGQVYTLDGGTLTRSGAAPITAEVPVTLTLDGGRGGNRFDVESLAADVVAAVNAGPGGDLVRMRGGPVRGALTVNGRGNTALGYAAYTRGVYVNLRTGIATDLSAVRGVHEVTGGQGHNVLIADDSGDILVGGPGDNVLIGGQGRDVLIGGGGRSVLIGGGGEDILIGGRTAYDSDSKALAAIRAEWSRTDLSYSQRVDHLLHGGGLTPVLNASTVFDDGDADVLVGGTGRDLFYAGALDVLVHWDPKKEVVVKIHKS